MKMTVVNNTCRTVCAFKKVLKVKNVLTSQVLYVASLLSNASFVIFYPEHKDSKVKAQALRKVILKVLNGERLPSLLMTIIR